MSETPDSNEDYEVSDSPTDGAENVDDLDDGDLEVDEEPKFEEVSDTDTVDRSDCKTPDYEAKQETPAPSQGSKPGPTPGPPK